MHLASDSPSFIPVHPQIRAIGPRDLHHAKGRGPAIRQQLTRAATIAGKRGAYSNYILRLIVIIAGKLGAKITSKQAAKFIPIVGGVAGAGINYAFAGNAAKKMRVSFKDEYFRTWQAGQ